MFFLFHFIVSFVLGVIDGFLSISRGISLGSSGGMFSGVIGMFYCLVIIIPSIAVSIRRLHDTDHSGWWLLITLVPFIGFIVLFVLMVEDSKPGQNQYGENPKETTV
jgi:uncharacterized membrane protein YhaH (DUF805 family)